MHATLDTLLDHLAAAPAAERLAVAITEIAKQFPDRIAIVAQAGTDARRAIDYSTLAAAVLKLEGDLEANRPVGVVARAVRPESLAVITAACGRQRVPLAFVSPDSQALAGELHDWAAIDDGLSLPVPSGRDSVLAAARLSDQWHGLGWLMVYDSARWAGIQVWVQALLTGGRLVVPASRDPDVVALALVNESVQVMPATPTLLRRLLTSADRSVLCRGQVDRITLGGEAADAQLLNDARAFYPQAKITQVYATTELGEVFRVADGKPGFPANWLGKSLPGGVRLATRRDGELLVQLSRDTADVGTGDLVERRGDRYEFVGRRTDVIIVGGAKVFPNRVEEVLRGVPGVAEARVYGLPSAITGELVAAEVVLADPLPDAATPEKVRAASLTACRDQLEPQSVPRILDIVKKIATTSAGKTPRSRP